MSLSGSLTPRPLRLRLAVAALGGVLVLGGCSSGEGDPQASDDATESSATTGDGPRLVQGGEPGEAATEVPEDTTVPAQEWTHEDEMFMQMMIPHHAQALQMSALVPDRASDDRVRRMADRIEAAQGPEIQMMAAWLDERELAVPRASDDPMEYDHGEHGHMSMKGMLTAEELDALAAAKGTRFDKMFLRFMIKHHEGAVAMANETAAGGLDVIAGETRDGMASHQSVEIGRMQAILDDL